MESPLDKQTPALPRLDPPVNILCSPPRDNDEGVDADEMDYAKFTWQPDKEVSKDNVKAIIKSFDELKDMIVSLKTDQMTTMAALSRLNKRQQKIQGWFMVSVHLFFQTSRTQKPQVQWTMELTNNTAHTAQTSTVMLKQGVRCTCPAQTV